MPSPTFIIITHGNTSLGMGHFVRSRNIFAFLTIHNQSGLFFVNRCAESERFFKEQEEVVYYQGDRDLSLLDRFLALKPLIIFDCGQTSREEVLFFQSNGCKVASFDDTGEGRSLSQLLIDANLDKESTSTNHLFGAEYICLGKNFDSLSSKKQIPNRVAKVLIAMGGYDSRGFALTIFRALFYSFYYSFHDTFEIHLKLPANNTELDPFFKEAALYHDLAVRHEGNRYDILVDEEKEVTVFTYESIPDMAALVVEVDVLLTSGGLTLYEGLTAGTYTLAFPQNTAEKKVVERLFRKGYLPANIDEYRLQEDLEYLFELSEVEFRRFLLKSQATFDGLGYKRVGNALLNLLKQVK